MGEQKHNSLGLSTNKSGIWQVLRLNKFKKSIPKQIWILPIIKLPFEFIEVGIKKLFPKKASEKIKEVAHEKDDK
jgi:hypothetical protein